MKSGFEDGCRILWNLIIPEATSLKLQETTGIMWYIERSYCSVAWRGKKNLLSFDYTTGALRVNFKIPREGKWSTQSCTAQPMLRLGTSTTYHRKYIVWRRQWDGILFLFWEPESSTSGSFHLNCDLDAGDKALFSSQKQQNWWQRLDRGSLEACAAPEGWLSRDTLSFIFSLKAWVWVSASYGSAFSWWICLPLHGHWSLESTWPLSLLLQACRRSCV